MRILLVSILIAAFSGTAFADQPMRVHSPAPHAHGVRSLHRLVYRSLAFLHKKTWHTANLKNVEKVWAAEEEQKKEEQKLERWKKEREEERQRRAGAHLEVTLFL